MSSSDQVHFKTDLACTLVSEIERLGIATASEIDAETLAELKLRDEHIVVLGIQKANGEYIGVPHGERRVDPGDTLVLYSTEERLEELDVRKRGHSGDAAHRRATEECGEASGFRRAVAG